MYYEVTNRSKNFTTTDAITSYLDTEVAKLQPIVGDYPEDLLLRVIVDDGGNANDIEVQLRLSLPGHMFVSHEPGPDFRKAFEQAVKELRRQVLDEKETQRDRQRQRG